MWWGQTQASPQVCPSPRYLADVLEVFDVVALGAHDLIDDVGSHLVAVLHGPAQAQAVGAGVQVAVLHLAGSLLHPILLVHP